jgi:hypothetical protein
VDKVNPAYCGATPREAQQWLRETWARVRAAWHRSGVRPYGFRVAEPHADGCPHWHAIFWFESETQAGEAIKELRAEWLKDAGSEAGARKHRVTIKRMEAGGASGYVAKYVAKNIDGEGIGGHQDDGVTVDESAQQGARRVDAWASLWGIRQFQGIGQASVTLWRMLRGVGRDQAERARILGGEAGARAWAAWNAAHKAGALLADWAHFMRALEPIECAALDGGAVQPVRIAYTVREAVSRYGEAVKRKVAIGAATASGFFLVAKWQVWRRLAGVEAAAELEAIEEGAAQSRPWTGFNNCTQRLTGRLRAALTGEGGASGVSMVGRWRFMEAMEKAA